MDAADASRNNANLPTTNEKRLIVVQPSLAAYRHDLFDRIAEEFGTSFILYYSPSDLGVLTANQPQPQWAHRIGPIRPLIPGVEWQSGALNIPLKRGDVIVISGAPRCLTNLLLLLKAKAKGARSLWWGHYWSSTSRPYRFFLRILLMRLVSGVIFYTDKEVREYRAGPGRRDKRPIHALNNGINTETIRANRTQYNPHQRKKALFFIGRLTEKAELHSLITALADPRLSQVSLDVIGDGAKAAELKALSLRLNLDARVRWHGGLTDEARIAAIANGCQAFVYPGGVGLSLIHAMAYGLPSVVHDDRHRHMPEIAAFQAGKTGLSFQKDQIGSLVDAIETLLARPDRLIAMSQKAIEVTTNGFNTEAMTDRFLEAVGSSFKNQEGCDENTTNQAK